MSKNRRASSPCSDVTPVDDDAEKLRHLKALKAEAELKESYRVRRQRGCFS